MTDSQPPAIAASRRSLSTLAGTVLVAKRRFQDYSALLGGRQWDVTPGTLVMVLMEGTTAQSTSWLKGNKVVKFLSNGLHGEIMLDTQFDANWGIISPADELKGKTFVFTGALTNTREYYKTLVECFGGNFGTSVGSKTSYLVMGDTTFQGDPNHQSTKAKKAKSLGVQIINESKFFRLINGTT